MDAFDLAMKSGKRALVQSRRSNPVDRSYVCVCVHVSMCVCRGIGRGRDSVEVCTLREGCV